MATSTAVEMQQLDEIEIENAGPEIVRVTPKGISATTPPSSVTSTHDAANATGVSYINGEKHGAVVATEASNEVAVDEYERTPTGFLAGLQSRRKGWGRYFKTREFWIVLIFGQVLSLLLTGQNTFSQLLVVDRVSIPSFQCFFNYAILNVVFTSYTIYRYGFKKWAKILVKDSWKFFLWAAVDVEGNFCFVLAYRYTNILSVTLIDFWAIAVVVLVSLIFLKVRYRIAQYVGILVCVLGLGLILVDDAIHGNTDAYHPTAAVKGDLLALLGATFYGLSNVLQEYWMSKRPLYEALGMLGFWGTIINGIQAGALEHHAIAAANWTPATGGWFAGFTILLAAFYMTVPVYLRLASAAVFNISLLSSDFWSVIVGVKLFHLPIHPLYPVAFVCIVLGLFCYFLTEGVFGDAKKPWLGAEQEKGVSGVGTARRKLERQGEV